MVAFQYLLIALPAFALTLNGYLLSDLSDYRDFDVNCVAEYLKSHHNFSIKFKARPHQSKYCKNYIEEFRESFYESLENVVINNSSRDCITNLIRRHNVSDVFFKAIGYNYFKRQLVTFSSNKSCDGVVNVLRVDNDCEYREMTVNFIGGNQSLWKVRPCLDDLFGEFNVDGIVFVNQASTKIGLRRFGNHLSSLLKRLADVGRTFCSETNLDLMIKYFSIFFMRNDELEGIYNQTQLECFKNYFINHRFINNSAYRFAKAVDLQSDPDYNKRCDRIMQEQVESAIVIDLFGFTESSRKVKDCVVAASAEDKLIEQVILLPAIAKYINLMDSDLPRNLYQEKSKRIIELTLECLREF